MKKVLAISLCLCVISSVASADTFGTGANQFSIDFVPISGDTGNLGSWSTAFGYTFRGVNHDNYRMGKFEVTNAQWTKFKFDYGTVAGTPTNAYDQNPNFTGNNVPTNNVSWYEAAQFVNFLNTSTGHQAAYKFTGTQGTSNYTFTPWQADDAGYNPLNPFRNSNAYYFLPSEDEWVKAAYWNGTSLQTYATKNGWPAVYQGNGSNGGWNYDDATIKQPWNVGSGSEELNGTFDMMGNVWEWMESPYYTGNFLSPYRTCRGGSYALDIPYIQVLSSASRSYGSVTSENIILGFRVASVPEPCSLSLLFLGGLVLQRKKR